TGVVARVDDLAHFGESGRGDRATGPAHLEELRFGEFPSLGRVRHEHGLEGAVLASQPLHDPEKECLGKLAVADEHPARDVEHEEHDRVDRRLSPARELPEAQVLINKARRGARGAAALHHLLERSAPIETRARAAPIPALAYPLRLVGRSDTRLEVGKLHLLPQPVDDVVHLEFEQQLHLALVLPAGTFLARSTLAGGIGEHISRLGLALPCALTLLAA